MNPDIDKPVVMEKPARGREMETHAVPTDLLDTMRLVSAKKALGDEKDMKELLEQKGENELQLYHKGYVGDKEYLVPDKNLEAMKNLINFKMRRRDDSRFVRDPTEEDEKKDYQRYQDKLRKLFEKLESLEASDDEEQQKPLQEDEESQEEDYTKDRSEPKKRDKYLAKDMSETSSSPQAKAQSQVLRFLLSGHVKSNSKPIFIIQQYEGKSPFADRNLHMSSVNENDHVVIFVTGHYYSDNILEEENNIPKRLKIKPETIIIDERSRVYEENFNYVFKVGKVDVEFEGRFIQTTSLTHIPFVRITVKNESASAQTVCDLSDKIPTMTYISEPVTQSPFSKRNEKNQQSRSDNNLQQAESKVEHQSIFRVKHNNIYHSPEPSDSTRHGRATGNDSQAIAESKSKDSRHKHGRKKYNIVRRISGILFPASQQNS